MKALQHSSPQVLELAQYCISYPDVVKSHVSNSSDNNYQWIGLKAAESFLKHASNRVKIQLLDEKRQVVFVVSCAPDFVGSPKAQVKDVFILLRKIKKTIAQRLRLTIPKDILKKIICEHLEPEELLVFSCVSRQCRQWATDPRVWKKWKIRKTYYEIITLRKLDLGENGALTIDVACKLACQSQKYSFERLTHQVLHNQVTTRAYSEPWTNADYDGYLTASFDPKTQKWSFIFRPPGRKQGNPISRKNLNKLCVEGFRRELQENLWKKAKFP